MKLCTLLAMGMAASEARGGANILRNEHLTVHFEDSAVGPRLTTIEDHATGALYDLADSQEIALAVVPLDAVEDPDLRVSYALQDGFRFRSIELTDDQTRAELVFDHDLLRATITYELQPDAPVLRKTIVCTGGEAGAYVAGITHWLFTPDHALAWPANGALGQPAVVLAPSGGYFATLEWPRARVASIGGDIRVGYRPGYRLGPSESREVSAGSIGFFGPTREGDDRLEAARRAFFRHVADRVQPDVPFPVKFTTWGPWLGHTREDRILQVMDDLEYVGVDLFHFDAGWQWPDHPYSQRLPTLRDADDDTWDRQMTQPERLPNGFLPVVRAAEARGMGVSVWFDACGNVFVREGDEWAIRDEDGQPVHARMWEGRWPEAPRQSLASEYGDRLEEFVLEAMQRYRLDGIMFDNNSYTTDHAPGRRSLANGWNSEDVQLREIVEILDEGERRRPGLYRFYCRGTSWPWALLHATHIHAGDPGMSDTMAKAVATDYPARALAFERRHAWRHHYTSFVPPWGVKGDIAGWSVQQRSPIPVNLKHTGELIPAGEGWTQNMFTCFATTAVRDVRFSFSQMPAFDRDILKEWLAWDRVRSRFIFNCRPLFEPSDDPNDGVVGYSHVGEGRGVIYLLNQSFDLAEAVVKLDEAAGFRASDANLSAYLVYPVKAPLGDGTVSYGDMVRVPIIGKDCVAVEVGLEPPDGLDTYAQYEQLARSVKRSFDTVYITPADEVTEAVADGSVRVEVGDSPRDRRLARQIIEAFGAATGRRMKLADCVDVPAAQAKCRLIIGTHEGLLAHPDVGAAFRETLHNRYLAWDGSLVSAPLIAALPNASTRTFCLIAPRPEHLSRLSINLTASVLDGAREHAAPQPAQRVGPEVTLSATVPATRYPVLRFRPVVRQQRNCPLPSDLDLVRFQVYAEDGGRRTLLWQEDVPPFVCIGGAEWLQDRVISVADLAGREVTFRLTAAFLDGRHDVAMTIGFDRVALLALATSE